MKRSHSPSHSAFHGSSQGKRGWRGLALLAAVFCILLVLWLIPRLLPDDDYRAVFLLWLLAIVLYMTAVARERDLPANPLPSLKKQWPLTAVVTAILLLALLLRLWRLGTVPFTLGGDEGSQGLEALRALSGELRNPFSTGWLGVPTMSFFFNSLSIRFLGRTVMALRLPWALVGSATILSTFLLVKRLKGVELALATAVLLATYHYHIHFSRLGSNQIADPLFLSLALLFLYRGLDRRNPFDWALSGAITGLAFYFYAGARLTPVVITAVLAYHFILKPRTFWRQNGRFLPIALGAFLLVAAPMIQYAIRFPDDFNARLNQVGIIQSGWLAREVIIRGEPVASILFDQFRRAALAFNLYPDRTVWYGLPQPLLDPLFGLIFLAGLLYGTTQLLNKREGARLVPLVAWWWSGILLGGMLTESPPSSQRLISLAVPVCFFIAYALWRALLLGRRFWQRLPAEGLLAGGVLLFALTSLNTYLFDYTPQRLYGGPNAEMATQIAPLLNELKEEHHIYFVGAPWMYWGFATLPYLVPDARASDIETPLTAPVSPDLLPADKGAVFIIIPPRIAELDMIQKTFPQGERLEIRSPVDDRLMAVLYKVSR